MRMIGLVIAKRVSYNFLLSLYNESEILLVRKAKEVILAVLPLVEDKFQKDLTVEGASDLILTLLEKRPIFVKELKN